MDANELNPAKVMSVHVVCPLPGLKYSAERCFMIKGDMG